jgi:hypothetical protein
MHTMCYQYHIVYITTAGLYQVNPPRCTHPILGLKIVRKSIFENGPYNFPYSDLMYPPPMDPNLDSPCDVVITNQSNPGSLPFELLSGRFLEKPKTIIVSVRVAFGGTPFSYFFDLSFFVSMFSEPHLVNYMCHTCGHIGC